MVQRTYHVSARSTMSKHAQPAADVRNNLAENLDRRFAERNDTQVAQAVYQGHPVDAVYTLDEAGLLDGFCEFLQAAHISEHRQTFTIAKVVRVFFPAVTFVLF